jgi:hypothetical protein
MTLAPLVPGDQIHVLRSGVSLYPRDLGADLLGAIGAASILLSRGQTVTLTADLIEGNPEVLALIDDQAAQERRWGSVALGRGPFPADQQRYTPGSPEAEAERDRRRTIALAEPDEAKRAEALAAIRREFGAASGTTRLALYPDSLGRFPEAR